MIWISLILAIALPYFLSRKTQAPPTQKESSRNRLMDLVFTVLLIHGLCAMMQSPVSFFESIGSDPIDPNYVIRNKYNAYVSKSGDDSWNELFNQLKLQDYKRLYVLFGH